MQGSVWIFFIFILTLFPLFTLQLSSSVQFSAKSNTVLFISSIECIPRAFKTCRMFFLPQKKPRGKPLFKTLGNYDAFPLFTWPCGLVLTQSYRSAEFLVMMLNGEIQKLSSTKLTWLLARTTDCNLLPGKIKDNTKSQKMKVIFTKRVDFLFTATVFVVVWQKSAVAEIKLDKAIRKEIHSALGGVWGFILWGMEVVGRYKPAN